MRPAHVAAVLALACVAAPAFGDDSRCDAAYARGQDLRAASKLREARETFLRCADVSCDPQERTDCSKWIEELDAQIPSVIAVLQTADGRDVVHATVSLDGAPLADGLAGHVIRVDPGPHTLAFVHDGTRYENVFVARVGETARRIVVTLPPVPMHRPVPWTVVASFGVSVASFVAAGIVGGVALAERGNLSGCAPGSNYAGFCEQAAVDSINVKYGVTDALLGVGVVALGLAVVFFVTRPSVPLRAPTLALRF